MTCICQQMLNTGFTGNPKTDAWLTVKYDTGRLYDGWYRHVFAQVAWEIGERDEPPVTEPRAQLREWAKQIEAACPAPFHYEGRDFSPQIAVLERIEGRLRPNEKAEEEAEAYETALCLAGGGRWYDRADSDYDREIVREASARDVLTYQRLTKAERRIVDSVTKDDGSAV